MALEPIDLGDDDGFVEVTIKDEQGAPTVQRLDLYEVNNQIADYHKSHAKAPDNEYNAGLVEWMTGLGLPRCSHRMAAKFVNAIQQAVKKKRPPTETTPASPASMASTPSA